MRFSCRSELKHHFTFIKCIATRNIYKHTRTFYCCADVALSEIILFLTSKHKARFSLPELTARVSLTSWVTTDILWGGPLKLRWITVCCGLRREGGARERVSFSAFQQRRFVGLLCFFLIYVRNCAIRGLKKVEHFWKKILWILEAESRA